MQLKLQRVYRCSDLFFYFLQTRLRFANKLVTIHYTIKYHCVITTIPQDFIEK